MVASFLYVRDFLSRRRAGELSKVGTTPCAGTCLSPARPFAYHLPMRLRARSPAHCIPEPKTKRAGRPRILVPLQGDSKSDPTGPGYREAKACGELQSPAHTPYLYLPISLISPIAFLRQSFDHNSPLKLGLTASTSSLAKPTRAMSAPPLSQGVGYGVVLGLGFAFALGMIGTTWALKRCAFNS